MGEKLTKAQIETLLIAAKSQTLKTASELCTTPAACGALTRKGLLRSEEQSEQYRGERRVYYRIYAITPAGREALSHRRLT